jgi:UDP:flavonoid glycosyltransferase YjiC (YdhE family)
MGRFLISTMPASGHVTPALPLAAELCRRGHEVLWHTGDQFTDLVKRTGARFAPLVHTPDFTQIPVHPDPGAKGIAAGVSVLRRLFIDRIPGQVADYEQILNDFPADLLVADMCSLGADTLHAKGGPAYATLGINPLATFDPEIPPFGSRRPPATNPAGRLRNRLSHQLARRLFMPRLTPLINAARTGCGAPPLPAGTQFPDIQHSPYLHLMPTTLAFEYPRTYLRPQVHFVGPLIPPPPDDFTPPPWWGDLDGRRVVHVTQGTYATDTPALLRPAIEALAAEDVLIVATTPDPESAGPLPPNARVARFIPHSLLLPYVDVMVTNAGYNGVLTALANGVPLVCAGDSEDKPEVSARVAWSGAGIDLRTATPSPSELRTAVRAVHDTPSYRANARRIAADFATHNPPVEAAELLEHLVKRQAGG